MKPAAWNFALRAATKVAFATSLVGCGSVVSIEPTEKKADTDTGGAPAWPHISMPDAPQEVCEAPAEGWQTYDEATFDCCVATIEDRLTEGPLAFGVPVTEEVDGCCTQIVAPNYEALWSGQPLAVDAPDDVIVGCCNLKHGDPSCTPWGPPAPPAMDPAEGTPWLALMEAALEGDPAASAAASDALWSMS